MTQFVKKEEDAATSHVDRLNVQSQKNPQPKPRTWLEVMHARQAQIDQNNWQLQQQNHVYPTQAIVLYAHHYINNAPIMAKTPKKPRLGRVSIAFRTKNWNGNTSDWDEDVEERKDNQVRAPLRWPRQPPKVLISSDKKTPYWMA